MTGPLDGEIPHEGHLRRLDCCCHLDPLKTLHYFCLILQFASTLTRSMTGAPHGGNLPTRGVEMQWEP